MPDGLKNKTINGLFWSFIERTGYIGIQFIISIILARVLLPEQFGLIAMLSFFIAIAQSFIDSGFSNALIQKQNTSHIDECSILYFNIFVGFISAGLLYLAAPWIAVFYKIPILLSLTRVLSLNLIINAAGAIQTTLLSKRIDFKTQMKVSAIASIISGFIGVTMAYQGYGVWSLVALSLSSNILRTMFLWITIRWHPSLMFSFTSLRTMFSFGSKLLFSGLLDTVYTNIYLIVIGKLFSATSLGFYTQAYNTQQGPTTILSSIVGRVTFPVFSSMQEDKTRLKRGVKRSLLLLAMFNFPFMIGLAVVAKPLVLVLYTEKWLPCVPYLQLLCVVGILYPLHVINLNVLAAQGRSDLFFRLEIIKKVLLTIILVITCNFGIIEMIYGQIVTSLIAYYINSYYTGKLLFYPIFEQLKDIIPTFVLALLMGITVYLIGYLPCRNNLLLLIIQVLSGVILYIILCIFAKIPSFIEIRSMVQS